MIYMVMEIVLCIIIENKLLMMMIIGCLGWAFFRQR
jgi:hypothetical protein